jgi:MFS family permease
VTKPEGSLWQQRDFLKLWSGQTVSVFGSNITREGLPYAAILVLGATPVEMGLLVAARALPILLVGLIAGVWVDRLRRRPVMIVTDVGRAVLIGSIPVAALFGLLSMVQLYVVTLLAGLLTVFFDVANQAYLPSLVEREHVLEANSKLGASASIAEIGGPPLTGLLVQVISAPFAIALDAVSFLVSALLVRRIQHREEPPPPPEQRQKIWLEIKEGLRLVLQQPILRALMWYTIIFYFFVSFFSAFYVLYALNELKMEPGLVGLLIGLGGIGAMVGAVMAGRVARRFGLGKTLLWSMGIYSLLQLAIPLAGGSLAIVIGCYATAQLFGDTALTIFFINEVSLRQTIIPDRLLGRANASIQFLIGAVMLVGPLVAGPAGYLLGLRLTLFIAGLGLFTSIIPLFLSPVRHLHKWPHQITDEHQDF